jgi:hypothetical protein
MSLRRFLDAAYMCLVETYQAAGMNLIEALDAAIEYRAGGPGRDMANERTAELPSAVDNDASLVQLMGALKGSDFGGSK